MDTVNTITEQHGYCTSILPQGGYGFSLVRRDGKNWQNIEGHPSTFRTMGAIFAYLEQITPTLLEKVGVKEQTEMKNGYGSIQSVKGYFS